MKTYNIYSSLLLRNIKLVVREPKNFDSMKKYNILYMHDGQNLFNTQESTFGNIWNMDVNMSNLEADGYPETIVVGIYSSKIANGIRRLQEYSIFDSEDLQKHHSKMTLGCEELLDEENNLKSHGELYELELIDKVFPFIEQKYKLKNRLMMGSSMGGMFTLTFTLKYPNLISQAYCLSNAFWYNKTKLLEMISDSNLSDVPIYLDTGDKEVDDIET